MQRLAAISVNSETGGFMKYPIRFFAALMLATGGATAADATCPSLYTFTNGQVADATQVNSNFSTLQNCPTFTNTGAGMLATFQSSSSYAVINLQPVSSNSYSYMNLGDGATFGWQIGKDVNSGGLGGANGFYIYEID